MQQKVQTRAQDSGRSSAVAELKTPPSNSSLEDSVLGGILFDPEAMERVAAIIKHSDVFYVAANRKIYEGMLALHERHLPVDSVYLHDWLKSDSPASLDIAGGFSRLASLVSGVRDAVHIEDYAQRLYEYYLARKGITVLSHGIELLYNQKEPVLETLGKIEHNVFDIVEYSQKREMKSTSEILTAVFTDIESAQISGGVDLLGAPTGFYEMDMMSGGYQPGDLIYVAGRPGSGKTSISVQSAMLTAQITGDPVCIFSLEMRKEQLVQRLLSAMTNIDARRLRSGRVSVGEMSSIREAITVLSATPLYIDDNTAISTNEMAAKIRRVQVKTQKKVRLCVLDYVQMMQDAKENENRNLGLSRISRELKLIATENSLTVMGLSQLSRSVESRQNKRPILSDLRDSGSLEQDADVIWLLYRDEYYNPNTTEKGVAEVNFAKQRNGPVGMVRMGFDAQFTRFRDLNDHRNVSVA